MHVRSLITPLIDHELDEVAAYQVHQHLQNCSTCMALYQDELRTRSITAVTTPEVAAPPDLTHRLIALPQEMLTDRTGRFAHSHSAPKTRLLVPLMSLSLVLVIAGVGAILGLGQHQWNQRTVTPQVVSSSFHNFSVPAAAPTRQMQQAVNISANEHDPAVALTWLHEHGWVAPHALPAGMSVADVIVHSEEQLEIVITDSANHKVRIGEIVGHIDEAEFANWHSTRIGNFQVYDDGTGLWYFQCGEHVIAVDSHEARLSAKSLVEALPAPKQESPFLQRLAVGWDIVTRALFVK